MLYSSGTTGRPKGVKVPAPDAALGEGSDGVTTLGQMLFGATAETDVPLPGAALPRRAAPLLPGRSPDRRHRRGHGALRRRGVPGAGRAAPHTFSQVVPDDVHPDAEAPRGGADALRHVVARGRRARRGPLPRGGEVPDHRVARPDRARVLRRHRGQRLRVLQQRGLARPRGTVGKAIIGTVRIVGDDGEEVPVGETGTVYFEGGSDFSYHNDAEKTASSRDPKGRGWSTLGDVGRIDADGFLYLTDRKSYMIISAGVNIYPQEAENVLAMHPKVADVAVFGVPERGLRRRGQGCRRTGVDGRRRARAEPGADRVLQGAARGREVPPVGRLPRRSSRATPRASCTSAS